MEAPLALIERLSQQMDALLARLAAAESDNAALRLQVQTLSVQRDALHERVNTARARIDTLLARLPAAAATLESAADVEEKP